MKLKFLKDAYYNGERKYIAGECYEISDELGEATRWFKRGLVEEVKEEIKIEVKEVEKPLEYENLVKEDSKKENEIRKRKKGKLLNETSKIL